MPMNETKPRRGHYARKMGAPAHDVHFVQVDEDVWEAFDGDESAIRTALRALVAVVKAKRRTTRLKKRTGE